MEVHFSFLSNKTNLIFHFMYTLSKICSIELKSNNRCLELYKRLKKFTEGNARYLGSYRSFSYACDVTLFPRLRLSVNFPPN